MNDEHLEKLKIVILERLSSDFMDTRVDFTAHADFLSNDIYMRVMAQVWADDSEYHQTIAYPADWWQAFKRRWYPAWLLRLYPVREIVHEISGKVIYPELKVSLPQQTHRLRLRVSESFVVDGPKVKQQ